MLKFIKTLKATVGEGTKVFRNPLLVVLLASIVLGLVLVFFSCTPQTFIEQTRAPNLSPVSSPFPTATESDEVQISESSKALAAAKELGYTSEPPPTVELLYYTPELLPHASKLNTATELGIVYDILGIANTPKDLWIVTFCPDKNSNIKVFLDTKTYHIVGILENIYISRQWIDKKPP